MSELFHPVVPNFRPPTESEFHSALVAGLARVAAEVGRGNMADKAGRTTRALDKVFAGSTPGAKGAFDFLLAHPSALDEVAALYGMQICPRDQSPARDFEIIADVTALTAEHTEAMRDGRRDHRETCRIAEKARPVVARYMAIIDEADGIRGARR